MIGLPFERLVNLPIRILARDKLSVFLFHKVPSEPDPLMPQDIDLAAFENLLDTVIGAFNVIPLEAAVGCLEMGHLPPRAACITFDDGYSTWMSGVVPALLKRNMHATFFITTGQFGGLPLWHERIAHAVRHLESEQVDLGHPAFVPMPLNSMAERNQAVLYLERFLKYLTLQARDDLLAKLEAAAGVESFQVERMSVDDLRSIHRLGFGIGAHTDNHPILVYCNEVSAQHEIGAVRETLAGLVGGPVTTFAYPNGRPFADFSYKHVEMVKRAGYTSAVTTQWGVGGAGTSVYQIPRFTPWGRNPFSISFQLARNMLTKPDCVEEPSYGTGV